MQRRYIVFSILFCLFISSKAVSQTADIDVLHYNINLNINNIENNKHIGFTEINFIVLNPNNSIVEFDLRNQTIDSVLLNQENIDFTYQNNKISLELNNSPTEDTLIVKVFYSGGNNVEPYNWGGMHYSNNIIYNLGIAFQDFPHCYGRSWFVCKDSFTDKATFDLHITTNNDVIAVCSGNLLNTSNNLDNSTTYHWSVPQEITTYSLGLSIANFEKYEKNLNSNGRQIPLTVYHFSNDSTAIRENFMHIDSAFVCLEKHFGDFMFNRIGYSTTPKGSMEHVDNISLAHSLASNYSLSSQSVIVHEMGHSWFGNLITCANAGEMWINEGWTTFTERLSLASIYGEDVAKEHFRKKAESVISRLPIQEGKFALSGVDSTRTYSSTVYDKGALIAMSLKTYIGDSLFYSGVKRLLNDFAFSNIDSEALRDSLSSYTGIDLTDFFNYYVFDTTLHHFAIKNCTFDNNSADVTIASRTQFNDNLRCNNIRIPITFMDSAFNTCQKLIIDDGNETPHHFDLPFTPKAAFLDLEEDFFDLTTDCYKMISEVGNYEFPYTYFKAQVNSCEDTILIRPTLHWLGAKENEQIESVSRFSQKHYWTVEGINLEKANITAKFYFKVSDSELGFDNSLMQYSSAKDSLMLFYRENPESQWYRIKADYPSTTTGYVTTELRKGDYIMAIGDKNLVSLKEETTNTIKIKIHPNPSNGIINITHPQFKEYCNLKIYNSIGVLVHNQKINPNTTSSKIELNLPKGCYNATIKTKNNSISEKFIIE